MALTEHERARIRGQLVSNAAMRPMMTRVDVNALADEELEAFDVMMGAAVINQSTYNPQTQRHEIRTPDGGVMALNRSTSQWEHHPNVGGVGQVTRHHQTGNTITGTQHHTIPVAYPVKPNKPVSAMSVNELLGQGGGTPEERAAWESVMQARNQEKQDLIGLLVANAEGSAQEHAIGIYSGMSNEQLKTLVATQPRVQAAAQEQPALSYFGAQGAPNYSYAGVINEAVLDAPSLVVGK